MKKTQTEANQMLTNFMIANYLTNLICPVQIQAKKICFLASLKYYTTKAGKKIPTKLRSYSDYPRMVRTLQI
jgi:hypothetical protein